MNKRLTLAEIARMTGVTAATVSRALNPATVHMLSKDTSERILALCDKVGYRPSLCARGTVTGKTYKVGMILHDMCSDLNAHDWNRITCSLVKHLQAVGYTLILLRTSQVHTPMDQQVSDFLMSGIADFYVTSPSMLQNKTRDVLSSLPSQLAVICEPGVSSPIQEGVQRSDCDAFKEVWRRIPASMHGKICFVSHLNSEFNRSLQNIRQAAWELGIDAERAIVPVSYLRKTRAPAMEYAEAYMQMKKMGRELDKYEFIWTQSDLTALGIKDALAEMGRIAGRDYFLMGYGDLETFPGLSAHPCLSTISANTDVIAAKLCNGFMEKNCGRSSGLQIVPSTFIQRETF